MKTATIQDLQTRLPTILAWLEAGEEVVVQPKVVKAAASSPEPKVDWTQSAAFKRDRTGEPLLSQQDLDELYEDMGSRY